MTTVAVLADPPREEVVLPQLFPSPLSAAEATRLYRAMLGDVATAVAASGGETLFNYRDDEQLPEDDGDSEREIRNLVTDVLGSLDDVRFEVQVGSTGAARAGNTVTHLLKSENVDTAAVVDPTAAFVTRQVIDSAAMKLRSSDVVLGPATDGRVYYAGFGEPIDFEDAFQTPALETLTERAHAADLAVDYLPLLPNVERPSDLLTAVPTIRSRLRAGRMLPRRTADAIDELGLRVESGTDGPVLVRE